MGITKRSQEKHISAQGVALSQERYSEMQAQISAMKDGQGRSVDAGIRETVALLNLLGVPTVASCEGHMDHGIAAPWIDIQAAETLRLSRKADRVLASAKQKMPKPGERLSDEQSALFDQVEEASLAVIHAQLPVWTKLFSLLDAFYSQHHVPSRQRLLLRPYERGTARLESQGASMQEALSGEDRRHALLCYQQEMERFTDSLKARYFREEQHFPQKRGGFSAHGRATPRSLVDANP